VATWPDGFEAMKAGEGCPMCVRLDAANAYGRRFFEGQVTDAYLGRHPVRPGYAYVVWRGRHVTEPTELAPPEAAAFWAEVAAVATALEARYQPVKMNWLSLGNTVPHLHVHLVPRYEGDARAGGPLEPEAFVADHVAPLTDEDLATEATALARLLEGAS
jgi:diadenosine tetraphosphate (Ap4A) HIT family hydrolase